MTIPSLSRENRVGAALAAAMLALALAFVIFISQSARSQTTAFSAPAQATGQTAPQADAQDAMPAGPAPIVEPLEIAPVATQDAKTINGNTPFAKGPNPAAAPFIFKGPTADFARATDCLAAAVLYEAGDDKIGEQAVAQVVLNRARHPAFPASVCGVVFQGSERATGCQFTFTCDGALNRRYSTAAWERARVVAAAALSGFVYAPVGLATHYHTDWVVPYWSSSLEKIASVGTHLFFRWSGGWGRPGAFRQKLSLTEMAVAKLATVSPIHADGLDALEAPQTEALAAAVSTAVLPGTPSAAVDVNAGRSSLANATTPVAAARDTIVMTLDKNAEPAIFETAAKAKCGSKSYCKVLAWTDAAQAAKSEDITDAQRRTMAFSYLRSADAGFEKVLWNCKLFPRPDKRSCMRGI